MKTNQAVLLCAGKGKRLLPLTEEIPKPLVEVQGKSLIEHNLENLQGLVEEVILIIGYKGEKIKEKFGNSYGNLTIKYAVQEEMLGTGHALLQAKEFLRGDFLLLNGDDLYAREDLEEILHHPQSILSYVVEEPSAFGVLKIDEEGNLLEMIEKPKEFISNLINIGCYHLGLSIFDVEVRKSERGEIEMPDFIDQRIEKGDCFQIFPASGYWIPVNNHEQLSQAKKELEKKAKASFTYGTDGIRGEAHLFTKNFVIALCEFLSKKLGKEKAKILLGRDTRRSGRRIEQYFKNYAKEKGLYIDYLGIASSPEISYLLTQHEEYDCALMITASHSPASQNGLKFFKKGGSKYDGAFEKEFIDFYTQRKDLKEEEIELENFEISEKKELEEEYLNILRKELEKVKHPFSIALDCANGSTAALAEKVFENSQITCKYHNMEIQSGRINQNCGALFPEYLADKVPKENLDLGVSIDGDGDRITLLDEEGQVIDGDQILAFIILKLREQKELKKEMLVVTQYSNIGLDAKMKEEEIFMLRTGTGDREVQEAMEREGAQVGGEQCGHLIINPLKCGDGLLSAILVLQHLDKEKKASEELRVFEPAPQVLHNVSVEKKIPFEEIEAFEYYKGKIKEELGAESRIFIRYSGTEMKCRVMLEAQKEKGLLQKCAEELGTFIQKQTGGEE
jgi:phosphoglucosamine mutase